MLIESALGIVALIAVGMVFDKYTGGAFGGPPAAFAAGIALMAVCAWLGQAGKNNKCSMSQWYLCLQQHSAACLSL